MKKKGAMDFAVMSIASVLALLLILIIFYIIFNSTYSVDKEVLKSYPIKDS